MTVTADTEFKRTGDLGQKDTLEEEGLCFPPGSEEVCVKMQMNVK